MHYFAYSGIRITLYCLSSWGEFIRNFPEFRDAAYLHLNAEILNLNKDGGYFGKD